MSKQLIKAYVISKGKIDLNKANHYGVVICNEGKPVYKCDNISNKLHIVQKFAEMLNNSFQ